MNQQIQPTSILSLFDTNKEERQSFVRQIVAAIENGDVNPLTVHSQLKSFEDIITQLTSLDEKKNKNVEAARKYRDALLTEAGKYGKSFEHKNGKFEIKEVGTKYDYEPTGDYKISDLLQQKADLDEQIKIRQKFLQNIPASGTVDPETGSMIYPPAKTSTTSVTVSLR